MTALDLRSVAAVMKEWIVDDLILVRDRGVVDDTLNPDTLLLTPTVTTAEWAGKGAIQPISGFMAQQDPDVARVLEFTEARHRALLNLGDAPTAKLGDLFTVAAVNSLPGDPKLVGGLFEIVDFGGVSSFAVVRVVYLKQVGAGGTGGVVGAGQILTGHGPPTGIVGTPGLQYVDLDTGTIYRWA